MAIDVAVELIDESGNQADLADTLVRAASLLAAAGRRDDAVVAADRSRRLYEAQQRDNLLGLVDLLLLEIDDVADPSRLDRALSLARRFESTPPERDRALIVALECATALDDRPTAADVAEQLGSRRSWLSAMIRIRLDLARAKHADVGGDRAAARRLVSRALRDIQRDNALDRGHRTPRTHFGPRHGTRPSGCAIRDRTQSPS